MTDNPLKEALIASMFVSKYAGMIVLSDIKGEILFRCCGKAEYLHRPAKTAGHHAGIYEINNPNENSPVLITTNFSLTYFIVSGEIETSKVPSYC